MANLEPAGARVSWSEVDEQRLAAAELVVRRLKARKAAADRQKLQDDIAKSRREEKARDAQRIEAERLKLVQAARKREDAAATLEQLMAQSAYQAKRNGKRGSLQVIPSGVTKGRIGKSLPQASANLRRARGLRNPENLCYRHSLLQCMIHTPEFYHLLGNVHKDCPKENNECVTCALQALVAAYWDGSKMPVLQQYRADLNDALKVVYPMERDIQSELQADPHEWMMAFVRQITISATGIDPDFNREAPEPSIGSSSGGFTMSSLFFFEYDAVWTCVDCHMIHPAQTVPSFGLPITMRQGFNGTIEEHLRDEDASPFLSVAPYACDSKYCRRYDPSTQTKRNLITKAPEILIVSLGRFGGLTDKLRQRVRYGRQLDLSEFAATAGENIKYQLNGVVTHRGSKLNEGHYVANVACQTPGGNYCTIDDFTVRPTTTNDNTVLNPQTGQVYLLVYSKV